MKSDQRTANTGRDDAAAGPRRWLGPDSDPARSERPRRPGELPPEYRRTRRPPPPRPSQLPFFVGALVAAGYVLLALADGGFAPGVWAEATVVVWWTAFVAAIAGAWPRSRIPGAAIVAGGALLALAVLTGVSMEWASDVGAAYADAIRALGYLGVLVLAAIICRAGAGTQLLAGTAVGIFVLGALALISRLEPGFTGGPDELLALNISGGRLSYPLGYWNALGACMALGLVLCGWLGAGARSRLARAVSVAAIPVLVLTLFFSGSRGGALAAAVGLTVLILAGPRRVTLASVAALGLGASVVPALFAGASAGLVNGLADPSTASTGDVLLVVTVASMALAGFVAYQGDRWLAGIHLPVLGTRRVVTACVIVGVLGTLVVDPVHRLEALDAGPGETQLSAKQERTRFATVGGSGRVQFWDSALDAFAAEPLRGIGAGGFEYWWNLDRDIDLPVTHAHSLFLESAAEIGIGGLLLVIAFFAAPVVAGIRRRLAPTAWADPLAARGGIGAALAVLAAGLLATAVEWTWEVPVTFVPVVIAAAFLCVPAFRPGAAEDTPAPRDRRLAFAAIFAVVALGSTAAAALLFLGERELDASRTAAAAGDSHQALDAAEDAKGWIGFSARPYEQIAIAERQLGKYADARRAIDEAEERADEDWSLWFTESGIDFEDGRTGRAIYNLNHAQALNPLAPERLFATPSAIDVSFYRNLAKKLGFPAAEPETPAP
jgi:hypothetical protein